MTIRKTLQLLLAASMVTTLLACTITNTGGHLKEDEALQSVKVGTTTKEEARGLLGSPSSESSFGPPAWYYVSSIQSHRSLFAPEVIDQRVVEINFDTAGVVTDVKHYALSDSKNVEIATQTTPAAGQKLGFMDQIIGNLGRFNNNSDSSTSNSHSHGTVPGGPGGGYPGR